MENCSGDVVLIEKNCDTVSLIVDAYTLPHYGLVVEREGLFYHLLSRVYLLWSRHHIATIAARGLTHMQPEFLLIESIRF